MSKLNVLCLHVFTFNIVECVEQTVEKNILKKEKESTHGKISEKSIHGKKYVSKRIQCENCDKKFNKTETFRAHMNKHHKINISNEDDKIFQEK